MESTAFEISNLVGMYAFLIKDEEIRARVFIKGKANNTYFICQVISAMTGEPNIAKLMTAQELAEWVIISNQELANSIYNDYCDTGHWRYGLHW